MAATWKTVRVFISSTFRDMHAERDHLVKVVFPKLRHWCEERRLHLVDIDLRWGVTKEEADNGRAIEICLQEIDGSRPFFVCILGSRYGWVPQDLPSEEHYLFRGLQQETGLSITHLEIIHATKEPVPLKDGNRREVCDHAFFYFRRPECVPRPEALISLTDPQRQEHAEAFFEGNPVRRQKLEDLKGEIRERFRGQDRVWDYQGTWDATADNPEDDKLQGRLTGLDEFGVRVEADLKRGIEAKFAEHIAAMGQATDPLAEERSAHEAFIENRTQIHVPRIDVERQLTAYVDGHDPRPRILSGPPGSGKSAILAHWVKERSSVEGREPRNEFLIARFIGASPFSTNLGHLLGNLSGEMVRHFELTEEVEEEMPDGQKTTRMQPTEVPGDPAKVLTNWPRILEAAGAKGKVVVVLDAVNQLDRSADPLAAYWLPHKLPVGVRIIVSVLDHGRASHPDHRPTEGAEPDWLATLRRRELPEVLVPEMTDDCRRRIIRELPTVFCKTLADDEVTLLLENEATRNPLFLTVALEELRIFGSFEQIPRAIAELPHLDDCQVGGDVKKALAALFGRVLVRLERDTRRQVPDLVPTLFRMLASAREGLSEQELDGVLARQLPDLTANDRQRVMQVVLRQVRPYIVRKGAACGALIDFYHRSFWKAVLTNYMPDEDSRRQSHRDLADYFAEQPYYLEQIDAADSKTTIRIPHKRKVVELPWQRVTAKDWEGLEAVLTELPFLEAKVAAGMAFELAGDFTTAVAVVPTDRPKRRILRLLEEALRRDLHFIARHAEDYPQGLFQCLWNSAWWYDTPAAEAHYDPPQGGWPTESLPWQRPRPSRREIISRVFSKFMSFALPRRRASLKLCELLDRWRAEKEAPRPAVNLLALATKALAINRDGLGSNERLRSWVRSTRPPALPLGSAQLAKLIGHTCGVLGVAFSPDGRRIISGSSDGTVRIWDSNTGKSIARINTAVTCVAVSLDGRLIASGSADGTVRIWDANSGAPITQLAVDKYAVLSLAFSPDGHRILSGSGGMVREYGLDTGLAALWDVFSGEEIARWPSFYSRVHSVAFSPDGHRVAVGAGKDVWVRDSNLHKLIAELDNAGTVAFSADGRRFATRYRSEKVRIWEADSGKLIAEFDGVDGVVTFTPDGRIASRSGKEVAIWDSNTGEPIARIILHRSLNCLAFSPDGRRIVGGSSDGTVRVWDAYSAGPNARLSGHASDVTSLAFSPDGRHISSWSNPGALRVWDASTGESIVELAVQSGLSQSTAFSLNCRSVATASNKTVRIFDAATGEAISEFTWCHMFPVLSVTFSPDGHQVATASGSLVLVGGVKSREPTTIIHSRLGIVTSLAFGPEGRHIVTGGADGRARVWDANSGEMTAEIIGRTSSVKEVAFSLDGRRIAIGSADRTVRVWDAYSGECLETIEGTGDVRAIANGPRSCSYRLISRGLETVVESARTGEPIAWFPVALSHITSHPSGRKWAAANANHVCILELAGDAALP